MATEGAAPLPTASAVYGEAAVHLKDFAAKHPIPNLVRVAKGQYRNIGVSKSVSRELYLHSVRTCPKILAVGVKIKDSKKTGKKALVSSDQKYALPVTYQGWWELLSEDGKAIRPLATVAELARLMPSKILVREPIKALVGSEGSDLSQDRSRTLHSGEQLSLVGDVVATVAVGKGATSRRMLRVFDSKGEVLYLGLEQKGLFSPVATHGTISGAHTIQGLVERFRLPLLVRLVHGIIPMRLERNSFTGVFRLLGLYDDDTAFVMPLKRDAKMVPISTREPLKVVPALNFDLIQSGDDCVHYHQRCGRMIASYLNSIHVLVNPPDITSVQKTSTDSAAQSQVKSAKKSKRSEEDILFEEVDDIYVYVRDGGAPPPPRPRPPNQMARVDTRRHNTPSMVQTKPVSPVIREYEGFLNDVRKVMPTAEATASPYNDQRHSDENYWEEPIYDDIEKFQRKIQEGHHKQVISESMEVLRPSSDDAPRLLEARKTADEQLNTSGAILKDYAPVTNRLEAVAMRAPLQHVNSLRQIYKYKDEDTSSGSRPGSLGKSTEDLAAGRQQEDSAPPLPPKRFELLTEHEDDDGLTPTQSKSLPRPSSKVTEVEVPSKSLPKDIFKFSSNQTKTASSSTLNEPVSPKAAAGEKERNVNGSKKKSNELKKKEAESKKRDTDNKKKEAELKKKEAANKKKEKREESRRRDSPSSGDISMYGVPQKSKASVPLDIPEHSSDRIDIEFEPSSPVNAPAQDSPSSPPYEGKGRAYIATDYPLVTHDGSMRRHSHSTSSTSPPGRVDAAGLRRHSGASRGTSVNVTLGVSPQHGQALDVSSALTTSGTSVKVRSNGGQVPYSRSAPGTHTQRIALTPMNAHMGRREPQYVAVARVGDDRPSAPSADKSNGSVANLNRHIQSVHL